MEFNGVRVEPGDIVAFRAKSVPDMAIEAAVIDVRDGVLKVMSTELAACQHKGDFPSEDVTAIKLSRKAEKAIPQESFSRRFKRHQRVSTRLKDHTVHEGKVIAAHDGFVAMRRDDGELITGRSMLFEAK
jgi:hypothetical protein